MSDEQKESRINIEDLAQAEQELTTEEAQGVQGGAGTLKPPPPPPPRKGGNVEFEWKVEEGES